MQPPVLLVFKTSQEECAQILRGLAQYCRTHQQWDPFLDDEARAVRDPEWLRSTEWRGVISRHTTPGLARHCRQRGIPLVDLSEGRSYPGVPKVRPDNVGIGHLGAEHLLDRGFRHFGFSGYSNEAWSAERRDGFVEALHLAGMECDVLDVHYPGRLTPVWDQRQRKAIAAWLGRLPKPVGVMACCDMRAQEIAAATHAAGLAIPEEVAILGANNETVRCDLANPALSSVAPNAFQSGFQAAEMLARLMRGSPPGEVDVRVEPLGVATRRSTDILAIPDKVVVSALQFIRLRACDGVKVGAVVRHSSSSRSQLEKKFRQFLGRSPQAEIRRVQVEKVRQLLAETIIPLKKIAELAGYEHVEYMSVVFKRLTGETPGAFRQRARVVM